MGRKIADLLAALKSRGHRIGRVGGSITIWELQAGTPHRPAADQSPASSPGGEGVPHHLDDPARRDLVLRLLAARRELDDPFRQRLPADHDADREPDQVGVLELHPGPLVAVVVKDLDAGAFSSS